MTTARTGTHRTSSGGWTGPGSVAAAEFDIKTVDGRREAWIVVDLVGGYVCAEPDPGLPDGICGMPVESEPCDIHHPDTTDQQEAVGTRGNS